MSSDELMGMALFFGSIVSIIFILTVGSIIKAWMKKGATKSLSENREFLDALRDFKENMEKRMSNLEEIIADEKYNSARLKSDPDKERKNSNTAIELELKSKSPDAGTTGEASKLQNMLNL